MARKEDEFRPTIVSVLTVILFIISIGYFAYSGAGLAVTGNDSLAIDAVAIGIGVLGSATSTTTPKSTLLKKCREFILPKPNSLILRWAMARQAS